MRIYAPAWRTLAAVAFVWFAASLNVLADAPAPPERVLFVGNSYLYYNDSLHNHAKRMVAETHPELELEFRSATISGARLDQHSLDHLLDYKRQRVSAPFQWVILQGGSMEALTESGREGFMAAVSAMSEAIESAGARTVLYITPAYAAPHKKADPAMIDKVVSLYTRAAVSTGAWLAPVGPAFDLALRLRPETGLHNPRDGSHPSLLGTYLAACVVYSTLLGVSPEGLAYDVFGALDPEDTLFAQRMAWATVKGFEVDYEPLMP